MNSQLSCRAEQNLAEYLLNQNYQLHLCHNMKSLWFGQGSVDSFQEDSDQEEILYESHEKKEQSTIIQHEKVKGRKKEAQFQRTLRSKTNPKKRKSLCQKVKKNKEMKKVIRRKKDQNLCKKYHNLALKVMGDLKLDKIIKQYKGLIYRQDFFIIMLVLVSSKGVLNQFKQGYTKQVEYSIAAIKNLNSKKRQEKKKNEDLINAMNNSLLAMNIFIDGRIEQAIEKMFNIRLRNKNYIDSSIMFIAQIQEKFQKLRSQII